MSSIFSNPEFHFPYSNLKFPGQHSEERILFVTREGKVVLQLKLLACAVVVILGAVLIISVLSSFTLFEWSAAGLIPFLLLFWGVGGLFVGWWIREVYKKTLFIITTRRLTKFIHTTPWTRYQMSLGHDHIVDTGAYQKGWFQMLTGLGYFVARSSAGAVKNFKIINISFAEDLHNYINKLLYIFNSKKDDLDRFRPFIPHMKGDVRDEYVRKVAPEFSKPIRVLPTIEGEYLSDQKTTYLKGSEREQNEVKKKDERTYYDSE